MDKLTLNLFNFKDKSWQECYLLAVQRISANPDGMKTSASKYAAQAADQFIRDLRNR